MWTIDKITHVGTMANQRQYAVTARHVEDVRADRYTFTGAAYGMGPVYVAYEDLDPIRVSNPERFGETFDADWIRRYFA